MSQAHANDPLFDLGEIHWRIPVQPLGFDAWLAMQKRMFAATQSPAAHQALETRSGTRGWRAILGWIALVVFFLAVFQFIRSEDAGPGGFFHELRSGCVSLFSVGPMVMALWIFLAGMVATVAIALQMQRRAYRRVYERARGFTTPRELVLGENGFWFRAPDVDMTARWTAVSDEFVTQGAWFLVIEQISAAWSQTAALGAEVDPVRAFVRARAGLSA